MPTTQVIVPLERAKPPFFFGVDVGGTNIKIGLVDDNGATLDFEEIETNEPQGPQQAVDRVAASVEKIVQRLGVPREQIKRLGLGTPGTMDIPRGVFVEPPNLPNWYHFPIRDAVATACQLPVSFINDANAASFGEFWVGTGAEHNSLILLTLGTGVGGGIIVDGHLINGVNSFGSECGHIIVDSRPDARLCVWGGGRGQLEAYASASALAQHAEQQLKQSVVSSLTRLAMAGKAITAKRIYEAAESGDEFSLGLIDETAFYLGIGVTTLVHTVDPGIVVLGGAMNFGGPKSRVGQRFLEKVRAVFAERTFPNVLAGTKIDFASLGGDAGYVGAAGIARKQFLNREE